MIAVLDVDYRGGGARAACALIKSWTDSSPGATYVTDLTTVRPYEPGRFYLRELPCLLAVLDSLRESPKVLVVDGYVWLARDRSPGLGFYLHQSAGGTPVVGIAKTKFRGLEGSDLLREVIRGQSTKPLYVTAVGMDSNIAAAAVASMSGEFRIPEILRLTDRLARSPKALTTDLEEGS